MVEFFHLWNCTWVSTCLLQYAVSIWCVTDFASVPLERTKLHTDTLGAGMPQRLCSKMMSTAFWGVTPCSLVEVQPHFGGMYCLHLSLVHWLLVWLTLQLWSVSMSAWNAANSYQTIWHHKWQYSSLLQLQIIKFSHLVMVRHHTERCLIVPVWYINHNIYEMGSSDIFRWRGTYDRWGRNLIFKYQMNMLHESHSHLINSLPKHASNELKQLQMIVLHVRCRWRIQPLFICHPKQI